MELGLMGLGINGTWVYWDLDLVGFGFVGTWI
jgi:hypothetical protein